MDDIAILLLDGPNDALADLALLLKRHGYRPKRVFTEHDAVGALESHAMRLVFIDLARPDATKLCQRLRETAVGAVTPMIMMGALGAPNSGVAHAMVIGADFFFEAPWQDDAVLAKVRTYVGEGAAPLVEAPPPRAPWPMAAPSRKLPEPDICEAPPEPTPHVVVLPKPPDIDLTAIVQPSFAHIHVGLPPPRPTDATTPMIPCEPGTWTADPPQGSLDTHCHVAYLLTQAWMAQATGRMDFRQGDVHVCLWMVEGSPCGYTSNLAHDHLAEFLSRTGSIRHAAYRQLRLQSLPNPRLTLAYLVRLGEISSERIWSLLTAHLAEQTYGLFAWETGDFCWHADVMPLDERISVGMPAPGWLLEGLRRKYDMPRLVPHIGGLATLVAKRTACEALVPNLQLEPAEARIVSLLDGTRTLEDVASSAQATQVEAYRLVLLLSLLDHVRILARGAEAPPHAVGANPVRDAQRITEKLQQARLCDYFEILGLRATASVHEVDLAAGKLHDVFHPSRFQADLRDQFEAELAEIAEIIADAKEVLGDEGKRQAYAEHAV